MKFTRSIVHCHFDSIAVAVRLVGVLFSVYWICVAIYPFSYASLLRSLNLEGLFWPLVVLMFALSQMLLWDRWSFLASAGYIIFFFLMHELDLVVTDLHWVFVGWMLAASMLIRLGVPRRWILELGWVMAGVIFFVQGLGKIVFVGADWVSGYVTGGFLYWAQPGVFEFLSRTHWLDAAAVAAGYLILGMHLAALPLCLVRRTRVLFLMMIVAFHVAISFSQLYFISLGMLTFWIFLADPAHILNRQPVRRADGE